MNRRKVLIIWDTPRDIQICIEGGWWAYAHEYKEVISLELFQVKVIPTIDEDDFGSINKECFETRKYRNTTSIFEIIRETIEYFKIDPEVCDFIHLSEYRYGYTHYFMLLVMFNNELFFGLDLYCGAGGVSVGLHQALVDKNIEHIIIGIDNRKMLDYPHRHPFIFIKENVFKIKRKLIDLFDFRWGSPPCQKFVCCNLNRKTSHPNLINKTRKLFRDTERPYVIENVQKAPIRRDIMLCGTMFNLGVFRHRFFEIEGFICYQPKHLRHKGTLGDGKYFCIHSAGPFPRMRDKTSPVYGTYEDWKKAMDIDWISFDWTDSKSRKSIETKKGPILPSGHPLVEAVPPAYSQYIMEQFLKKWLSLDRWTNIK